MARRLFHAIVLVGTGMGAACASRDAPAPVTDSSTTSETATSDDGVDTFPGIMPIGDTGTVDTSTPDTNKPDTFPMIVADTSKPDTFPGIMPADIGASG